MKGQLAFVVASFAVCTTAGAATVSCTNGNIFFTSVPGRTRQLTATGRDAHPTLSPDQRIVAFIRTVPGAKIPTSRGDVDRQEMRIIGVDGLRTRRLVRSRDPKPGDIMSDMADFFPPQFSPDGRTLYFMTGCGAVDGCLYKVDVHTRRVRWLGHANGMQVLRSGHHAGYLLVQQHQYPPPEPPGGAYEEFWLVSPQGKPVRDLGPGEFAPGHDKAIRDFTQADAIPHQ